jgi:transposase-like protein
MERNQANGNGEIPSTSNRAVRSGDSTPPDSEVQEEPERRRFSAAYKARIVRAAEACMEKGQIAALLRREGLYSSQLCEWRKKYQHGALTALQDDSRGRKKVNPLQEENERLQRQVARLEHRLQQAETIIEVQKKIAAILGSPPSDPESDADDGWKPRKS